MATIMIHGTAYNTTRTYPGTAYNETLDRWLLDDNDVVDDLLALYKALLRIAFCSSWLGLFIAVLLTFVVLSTPNQRRGPVFVIQCVSFLLALAYNLIDIILGYIRIQDTFNKPTDPLYWSSWNNAHLVNLALEHVVPLIADTAVLFKIRSFYPTPLYSRFRRFLSIAPLVALLVPRVALTIAGTYFIVRERTTLIWLNNHVWPVVWGFQWHKPMKANYQAEFSLGAVYCAYAAAVLLIKASQFAKQTTQLRSSSIRRRIRFFMEAMLMSFLPPMIFSIAAVGVLECPSTTYCYYREMTGSLVNTSVLFSLLATLWSSIRAANARDDKEDGGVHFSDGEKRSNPDTFRESLCGQGRGEKRENVGLVGARRSSLRARHQSVLHDDGGKTVLQIDEVNLHSSDEHYDAVDRSNNCTPSRFVNVHDIRDSSELRYVSADRSAVKAPSPPMRRSSLADHCAVVSHDGRHTARARTSTTFDERGANGADEISEWNDHASDEERTLPPPSLPWMRQSRS